MSPERLMVLADALFGVVAFASAVLWDRTQRTPWLRRALLAVGLLALAAQVACTWAVVVLR